MSDQQHPSKVCDEGPVRSRSPPLPEVIWSVRLFAVLERQVARQRAVRERDVEEEEVNDDHEEGLDEQRSAEVRAEPVEDFEDGGNEHDERDVE